MSPPADPAVWAIVVAAGSGSRFGRAKQYEVLAGVSVLDRSLTSARAGCGGGVVAVVPAADVGGVEAPGLADVVVAGGGSRSESVRRGLAAVPEDAEVIVVHDGARPLASPELFEAVVAAVQAGADGAVCAVPITDTIRRAGGGTVDRAGLLAVQTPQAFRAAALRRAHAAHPDATDDGALVEAVGGRVVTVPGAATNIKITHPSDLAVAAALLGCRP